MSYYGGSEYYGHEYANAQPPPRPAAEFIVPGPPQSAFSPVGERFPPSPMVVAVSPDPSRSSSRARGRSHGQSYLDPNGYSVHRSNSERGRVKVEPNHRPRSRHGRSHSGKVYYQEPQTTTYFIEDNESVYSGSSYVDSRDNSRSHSRHRGSHSRASSCASTDSADRYAVTAYNHRPSRQEEELTAKLKEIQKQLEKVQVDADRKKLNDDQAKLDKLRTEEIERKVKEQMKIQRQKEDEEARAKAAAIEAENKRIMEAAKKLLDEQTAAAAAKKAEEEKKQAEINALMEKAKAKFEEQHAIQILNQPKTTYTRFSKAYLCKEALEEARIAHTEDADNFLVHRFVEKDEQQKLWNRTEEIRSYYRRIQEAAEKAPTVVGPNGNYVKYVQIAGQPYPMAIPVTVTQTPGGGQTQRVDAVKIKWSDIFKQR